MINQWVNTFSLRGERYRLTWASILHFLYRIIHENHVLCSGHFGFWKQKDKPTS